MHNIKKYVIFFMKNKYQCPLYNGTDFELNGYTHTQAMLQQVVQCRVTLRLSYESTAN